MKSSSKILISEAISRIYEGKDHDFYVNRCRVKITLPTDFWRLIKRLKLTVRGPYPIKNWPAQEWRVDFDDSSPDALYGIFRTVLLVSKLAPLFNITHEFEIKNRHPQALVPNLAGAWGHPYISSQLSFHEGASSILRSDGYSELKSAELEEVIPNLRFPCGVTIFGTQVTVRYALFHDLLGLCDTAG